MSSTDGLSSHTLYAQIVGKAQTHEHESELYELAQLAGVTVDPEVFKIILDLHEMKCSPKAIADVIHSMMKHSSLNTSEMIHDLSHGEPHAGSDLGTRSLSLSNAGVASVTSVTHSPHSAPPSSLSQARHRASTSSVADPSRLSNNVTLRSNSGDRDRRSRTPGSQSRSSANLTSSQHPRSSVQNVSSSIYSSSRGDQRNSRPK